jgi:hypothetical protein
MWVGRCGIWIGRRGGWRFCRALRGSWVDEEGGLVLMKGGVDGCVDAFSLSDVLLRVLLCFGVEFFKFCERDGVDEK